MQNLGTLSICRYFYKKAVNNKKLYIVILLVSVIQMSLAPFINILFPKYLIEEILGHKDIHKITVIVAIIIFGNCMFSALNHILNLSRKTYEDWFSRFFTIEMNKKSMEMDFQNTEDSETMNLIQKAESGLNAYSNGIGGLSDCIINIVAAIITMVGIISILIKVSPVLILVSICAVIVNSFLIAKVKEIQIEFFNKLPFLNKLYAYIYQRIVEKQYAKEIRLYGIDNMILKKADDIALELNCLEKKLAKDKFKWNSPSALIMTLSNAFSYGYLGIMALRGKITVADFVMCVTALDAFTTGCLSLGITNIQEINKNANFMKSYVEYMNLEDHKVDGSQTPAKEENYIIEFKNVSFRYPHSEEYILKNINLTIEAGTHLAIVGENGAGKTTFIKLLCRLYNLEEGEILLNGVNINEFKYDEYINFISVVFQDFKLFSMSIEDNIKLDLQTHKDLDDVYTLSGVNNLIDKLNKKEKTILYKEFEAGGIEPSGGEAQKIAIARALYKDSPIVILDEPTAALDPIAEFEIYNHFENMIGGKTAIYISHRLSSCKFCDKIAVLANKTVVQYGTHEELMRNTDGLYYIMYNTQAKYYVKTS